VAPTAIIFDPCPLHERSAHFSIHAAEPRLESDVWIRLSDGGSFLPFSISSSSGQQQKQRKQQELSLREIKKGDEVVTAGGIIGDVIHIKETMKDGVPVVTMEDRITIKSAESRMVVERGRIAKVLSKTGDGAAGA